MTTGQIITNLNMISVAFVNPDTKEQRELINETFCETIRALKNRQKEGEWIKTPKAVMGEGYMWFCNNCDHLVYQDSSRDYPSEKYCPNCGADMKRRYREYDSI